jgi:hypothetical protein
MIYLTHPSAWDIFQFIFLWYNTSLVTSDPRRKITKYQLVYFLRILQDNFYLLASLTQKSIAMMSLSVLVHWFCIKHQQEKNGI